MASLSKLSERLVKMARQVFPASSPGGGRLARGGTWKAVRKLTGHLLVLVPINVSPTPAFYWFDVRSSGSFRKTNRPPVQALLPEAAASHSCHAI